MKTERSLRNDFTVARNRKLYQVEDNVKAPRVVVIERIDGSMAITYKDIPVKFREITTRPKKDQKQPHKCIPKKRYIPPPDYPWRKFEFGRQNKRYEHKESIGTQP